MEFFKTQLSCFFFYTFTIKFSENMLKPNVLTTLSFTIVFFILQKQKGVQ